MNFTREPIIETIITPREGYRLIVRSTKHESEEFNVEAVEVVSFGSALFYRSLEKPKPFLLPVTDYQIVEGKEARVVLKNAQIERTIKIGGGREASFKKEQEDTADEDPIEEETSEENSSEANNGQKRGRRRDRRRHRDEKRQQQPVSETSKEPLAPPVFTHLIPPPTNLISDSIQKYKEQQQQAQEIPKEEPQAEGEGDANVISRSLLEPPPFPPADTNFGA